MCKLGRFDLSDSNENGSMNSMVSEIVIHDEWNSTSWRFHADIAIVVLMDSVNFSDKIQPIRLPLQSYNEVSGVGTVVGWAKSEDSFDDTPNKIEVPVVTASECFITYPKLAKHASVSTFCGGFVNEGKTSCVDDAGAGFYHKSSSSHAWTVDGIVSGLRKDPRLCDINKLQLYTSVARFSDWITKVMQETMKVVWKYVDFNCMEYKT